MDSIQSLLHQTSGGQIPKHVEDNLMAFREDPTYLVLLLDILATSQDQVVLITASIEFKNTVLLHWVA